MKVLILGASGIVGQHMRLCVPNGVEPVWVRKTPDPITRGCDIEDHAILARLLEVERPDVIVNLAGQSSVDTVERDPYRFERINIGVPAQLAYWCRLTCKRLIHISSQAVHGGANAPYQSEGSRDELPVNQYGYQKACAEEAVLAAGQQVIRLTFILGIRPLPHVGRPNPLEAMIAGQSPQVDNRWFSPLMAWDAAEQIWDEVTEPSGEQIIQCGIPERWSRYEIAKLVNPIVVSAKHEDFGGLAPRPVDTTYAGSRFRSPLDVCPTRNDRAAELALFFGISMHQSGTKLVQGFFPLHAAVSDEWRARNPNTEAEMLDFYRTTEAYIWELSAYHDMEEANYAGMCEGIATRLKAEPGCKRVLCLGDGIGDLTLTLRRAGLDAFYHDLMPSRTRDYAMFRYWRQTGQLLPGRSTFTFEANSVPDPRAFLFGDTSQFYDAVVSLDFLEHVPNVEEWVRSVHNSLDLGGLLCAQNAFSCGSGPDGAMPMHLACNDHWEHDWNALLKGIGFEQLSSNWYRKI